VNVLFFLPSLAGYRDRVRLVMEISRLVDRLVLLVGQEDDELDTSDYPHFAVVPVGFRPGNRLSNRRKASALAREIINSEAINVVHDTFGNLLPLMRRKRDFPDTVFCTSLYLLPGWHLRHIWDDVPRWRMLLRKNTALVFFGAVIEKRQCALADYVVLQAPGLIDHLQEYTDIPASRIAVLTNNVDPSYWSPDPRNEATEPANPADPPKLLFVGRFKRGRGTLESIEVVHRLAQIDLPATLTMCGTWSHSEEKATRARIQEWGIESRVTLRRSLPRDELRQAYRTHDLLIYQSISDGSPRVVLEALACGIPTIASHHPGIDVLDPEGDIIGLTEYGDVDRIVALVQDFSAHRRTWCQRALKGRKHIAETFNSEAVAKTYRDFYSLATGQSLPSSRHDVCFNR